MNELLEFVKTNRQAIADLAKIPPPIIEKSMFGDISDHMYDVMVGNELEMSHGETWVAHIGVENIRERADEDYYYMDEEYMEVTNLTPDIVKEYLDKHNPEYVVVGEEFSTIFITDVEHPPMIANWMTGNDLYFFSSRVQTGGQAHEYEVNGKTLYITWGTPDAGS